MLRNDLVDLGAGAILYWLFLPKEDIWQKPKCPEQPGGQRLMKTRKKGKGLLLKGHDKEAHS